MKYKPTTRTKYSIASAISALLATAAVHADQTWDGTGGDNNWNTAANWGLDALPTFTNAINFGGNVRNGAVNNLTAASTIGGINFTNNGTAGNTNAFTLSNNSITLGGNIVSTASSSAITDIISLAMILDGDRTITTNANHNLTVSGLISETGGVRNLIKNGAGTLRFGSTNTYSGTTTINAGIVQVTAGTAGGSAVWGSGGITLSQGAQLFFNPTNQAIQNTGGFTVSGPITLAGGAGTATLRFAGNDNKFVLSGGITGEAGVAQTLAISQGSLSPSNGDRLTTQFTGAIANGVGGTLGVSVDFAGSSAVNQKSYTNFSGQNTFTGDLTITNSRGLNGTGNHPGAWVTIGGLRHDGFTVPTLVSVGTGFLGAGADYSGNISVSNGTGGLTTLGFLTSANQILRGAISGTGSLHQGGTGTVTLTGTNTYTGTTVVSQGTLQFAKQVSLYNGSSGSWTAANINVKSAATFAVNVDSAGTAGFDSTNLNTLLTNISVAGSATQGLQLGARLGIDTSTATGGTFTQGNVIANSSGANGGAIGLTKLGTGSLVFDKVNTYTGSTNINQGTLRIIGSGSINTSSAININGGTLQNNSSVNITSTINFNSGTVAGTNLAGVSLTIGAGQTISPGNSPGTMDVANQTWANAGTYLWEINNATGTAGTDPGWDLLSGTGALTITATSGNPFDIMVTSLNLGNTAGNATNFNPNDSYNWLIADFGSTISTFDASAFNIDSSGFTNTLNPFGEFNIVRGETVSGGNDTQLYLTYSIPEPSTALLGGLGVFALLLRRRR